MVVGDEIYHYLMLISDYYHIMKRQTAGCYEIYHYVMLISELLHYVLLISELLLYHAKTSCTA